MERALVLFVLSFFGPAVAHAAEASDCRNLLTLDEVATAVGGAAKLTNAGKRGEVATGSVENDRLEVCTWAANTWLAGVNVDVVPSLDAAHLAHGLDVVAYPLEERRKDHWSEQRQEFGGVHCSSLAPPESSTLEPSTSVPSTSEPSTLEPKVTGCVGEVNGAALYVGISSRTARPTFDLAKQLFDEAAARL